MIPKYPSPIRSILSLVCLLSIVISGFASTTTARDRSSRKPRTQQRARRHTSQARQSSKKGTTRKGVEEQARREEFEPRVEEDVEGRDNWFYFQRSYPFDTIPDDARQKAWDSRPVNKNSASPEAQQAWQPIGPVSTSSGFVNTWGTTSGRISAIAISPNNPQLILIGSPTGGIWRSTDGGTNFTPVSDNLTDLSISSIVFSKSNPQIVYASAGESNNRAYFGNGVLKSTDGGATWNRISRACATGEATSTCIPTPSVVRQVEVDPTNENRVYAIVGSYFARDNTTGQITNSRFSNGVYLSTDGGVNWTRRLLGVARNMAIRPGTPQTLYVAMTRVDPASDNRPAGIYRSTDGGQTWSAAPIYTAPYDSTQDIRVAVTPADAQKLYVYEGGTIGGGTRDLRVEVSSDGGASFTNRGTRNDIDPGQFNYNTYIAVDPTNVNTIFIGSRDFFKSTDGGQSFVNMVKNFAAAPWKDYTPRTATTHSDQQNMVFSADGKTIYLGNDGGLFKSTDGGVTLQSLNNTLSLTQFVGYAIDPNDATKSYGGTQDNGNQMRALNTTQWKEIISGDGGNTVVDAIDPSIVYVTYINGSVSRYGNFGTEFQKDVGTNAIFGEDENSPRIAFYPPFVGNGVDSKLYFGTWKLYVSTDRGDSWNATSATDLTNGDQDTLEAIGVSRSNTQVIYTGSVGGRAMRSSDGGVNWTDITAGLPTRSITNITVSPTDPATAFLTVSGFGSGHIFRTTNSGAAWTDISGNLPNIPANAFLIDATSPSIFYVGTDIGVFRSANGGFTWENFNSGLPPTVVTKLVASKNGTIQAATYGRGAYQLSAAPVVTNQIDDAQTFVRQHYLDFLSREPDQGGWDYWTGQITQCGANATCIKDRRIGVSAAYFIELEFQQTGSVVYRLYRAAFGNMAAPNQTRANITFSQFLNDRAQLVGGAQLQQSTLNFANQFVRRADFLAAYPATMSNIDFVNKLYDTAGLTPFAAERAAAIAGLTAGTKTRATVLLDLIDIQAFKDREYNPSFVLMQYFGYLRRDPDQGGYDFWLGKVSTNYREMVCAFLSSAEYQLRFGTVATQNDQNCAQFK